MTLLRIKIIGTEDNLQKMLLQNIKSACQGLTIEPRIITVTDWQDIVNYNIIQTPALVIRNQVISQGFVPSVPDLIKVIKAFLPTESEGLKQVSLL